MELSKKIAFGLTGLKSLSLTLQAIKYMMWLQALTIGLGIFLYAFAQKPVEMSSIVLLLLTLAALYLFLIGLRQGYAWVAILFAVLCGFDLILTITDGLSIVNILNLVDAVLSFVAICGIIIWFRERKMPPSFSGSPD